MLGLSPPQHPNSVSSNGFIARLIPNEANQMTTLLFYFHLLVFLAMVVTGVDAVEPSGQHLIRWGANFKASTLNGEAWRLLTSMFIHSGLLPLLVNMLALLCIGAILEPLLGHRFFILAYLLSGICGSVLSLWWHDLSITAGAAGAIFGLYGIFLALMLPGNTLPKESPLYLLITTSLFLVYNLAYDIKDGIDNASHVGGLLSGFIIGLMLSPTLDTPDYPAARRANLIIILIIFSLGIYLAYTFVPDAIARYEGIMKQFAANETVAMKAYRNQKQLTNYEWKVQLRDNGIDRWNQNLALLSSLNGLPEPLQSRLNQLSHYCVLRRSVFRLRVNSINQNTDRYEEQIRNTNLEIEALLMELRKDKEKEL